MRASLANHQSLSETMLFRPQPHLLNLKSLINDSQLKFNLHLFDELIVKEYFLLELLNCDGLQKVSHGTLLLIKCLFGISFTL
jgi:hypothetical protein